MKLFEKFEIGTPQCGFLGAAAGVVLAVLLLFLGFWKTFFICLLGAVGAYLGGVKDKAQFWKNVINKILPSKDN
ncbi:MAG: DUF2273 domain-containing protein [Clostridia bacterium]|nr:DUF2273 domain-containing protein [Clostridia bacterium]